MTRSKLNFDIGADEAPEISAEEIRRATAASGFGGGAPSGKMPAKAEESGRVVRRRRQRSGRVHQLNTRLRSETIDAIREYADRNKVPTVAEVIERAVEALQREESLSS